MELIWDQPPLCFPLRFKLHFRRVYANPLLRTNPIVFHFFTPFLSRLFPPFFSSPTSSLFPPPSFPHSHVCVRDYGMNPRYYPCARACLCAPVAITPPETPPLLICGARSSPENRPRPSVALSSQWGGWCGTILAREWLVAPSARRISPCLSGDGIWEHCGISNGNMWKSFQVFSLLLRKFNGQFRPQHFPPNQ